MRLFGCLGVIVVAAIGLAAWLAWTFIQVGRAPVMLDAESKIARYACVGGNDEERDVQPGRM